MKRIFPRVFRTLIAVATAASHAGVWSQEPSSAPLRLISPSGLGAGIMQNYSGGVQAELSAAAKRAGEVVIARNKGTLMFASEISERLRLPFSAKPDTAYPSAPKLFVGGAGHDAIAMGRGEGLARGGPGTDHFLLRPGDVPPGRVTRIFGDEGNDTVVLTRGFSIKDVEKRTPPYEVVDPVTKGRYIIDVETLGVVDPLAPADFPGLRTDDALAARKGIEARFASTTYSSKHYSTSTVDSSNAGLFNIASAVPRAVAKATSFDVAEVESQFTLSTGASPFQTYPMLFSIEGGFMAVGAKQPLNEQVLRNAVAAAVISVSADSPADTGLQLRLLTEDSVDLSVDLLDVRATTDVLEAVKQAGLIRRFTYNPDKTIGVEDAAGITFAFKPLLFVARTGLATDKAAVLAVPDSRGRIAFAIHSPRGFAQTFVDISSAKVSAGKDFVSAGIERGVLTSLARVPAAASLAAEELNSLVPQTASRVTIYPSLESGVHPFTAEIDGGILHLQAEEPIPTASERAAISNINISISSIFYARRSAHLYLDDGERIFAVAGMHNPIEMTPFMHSFQSKGFVSSVAISRNLVGPVQFDLKNGRKAKMMHILFGTRIPNSAKQPLLAVMPDDAAGRFAFGVASPTGFSQLYVDVGGSTLLPNLPKP